MAGKGRVFGVALAAAAMTVGGAGGAGTTTTTTTSSATGSSVTSVSTANEARSMVSLPDGRFLAIVVIGKGGSQSVSSSDGRYEIRQSGRIIRYAEGELSVDGKALEVPPFKELLTLRVEDGAVSVRAD